MSSGFEHQVIREWARAERPRERLMEQGGSALSDAELLAVGEVSLHRVLHYAGLGERLHLLHFRRAQRGRDDRFHFARRRPLRLMDEERFPEAEVVLANASLDDVETLAEKAAVAAAQASNPIANPVASEWYRRRMIEVQLKRLLSELLGSTWG